MGVSENRGRWFIRENPIKMDDLGVPLFLETSIYIYDMYNVICTLICQAGVNLCIYIHMFRSCVFYDFCPRKTRCFS